MAKQRVKKQAATKIEEMPRPPEELTPEQAEAVEGGGFSVAKYPAGSVSVEPPPPAPGGLTGSFSWQPLNATPSSLLVQPPKAG
jgi:hypothetical protein